MATIISENDFKYGTSGYAKALRARYGQDGYKKYTAYMNSIMTNPLKESHELYTQAKAEQYKAALANLKKTSNIWNQYKNQYNMNLASMRSQNNGLTLSASQRQQALRGAGDGATSALNNFNNAQSEVDYALSLYNDATHSSANWLS